LYALLGVALACALSACFPSAEGKQAERAQAKATPRSAYKATKSILLV